MPVVYGGMSNTRLLGLNLILLLIHPIILYPLKHVYNQWRPELQFIMGGIKQKSRLAMAKVPFNFN